MAKLTWSKQEDGFVVDCLLMAGDADIFNTVTFQFTIEEEAKMNRLLHAVETSAKIYDKYCISEFDDHVTAIAKKSKVDIDEVENWFDDLLMLSNGDDGPVDRIIGYRILKTDESGSSYAMFNNKPYKTLHSIDPQLFSSWDLNLKKKKQLK